MSNFIRLFASERGYVPRASVPEAISLMQLCPQFLILLAKCKINLLSLLTHDNLRP